MKIDGKTRIFAVLGHPVGHTLSPAMHNAAFEALGWNAAYVAFDIAPERLPAALPAFRDLGFGGVNITVPLKETAFRSLTRLDDSARLVGSVNTLQFDADGIIGHSTDAEGFLRARAEAFGGDVRGLSAFVLGAGGAGRALALALAREGARRIALADLDAARAERVAAEARALGVGAAIETVAAEADRVKAARAADLVIQATTVGLRAEDPSPLPPEAFRPGQQAFDLIYQRPETPFVRAARAGGARAVNGLDMLLYQGVRSFEIWTGVRPPVDAMRSALRKAVYGE